MPIQHSLWTVGESPTQLVESQLPAEQALHQMIVHAPALLSPDWMLIGSEQEAQGGRFDLLALAPDASLILIELKRNKTPRDVVAQAIDYASWVENLEPDQINEIYARFSPGKNLAKEFLNRFGRPLDDDELNVSHEIVIVAAELDASSERIVQYLNARGIAINVLFFRIFEHQGGQLISRAWLVDPTETQASTSGKAMKEPWNNEYYVSFGIGDNLEQAWEEARHFGFVAASGGSWYTRTLKQLKSGDRIWVNVPATGYVGTGLVTGDVQSAHDFTVLVNGVETPALNVLKDGQFHEDADDAEKCAYFVPVEWRTTVPLAEAVKEVGFFGNQNTVAAPRTPSWRTTVDRLLQVFPNH